MIEIMAKRCLLALSFLLTVQKISCQSKLHVEVFYESLCPDSLNFITQQLHPVSRELGPYLDIKLIPFGKSISFNANGNSLQFLCQHGPQECKGNKIQSCALDLMSDQNLQVEYVNCFMKSFKKNQRHEGENGLKCAEAAGLDFKHISQCFSLKQGTDLQLLAEQKTAEIAPKFVPTIVYNKNFNQKLQDESLIDFRNVVCQLIQQAYPQACQSSSVIRL